MKKQLKILALRFTILGEFIQTLWKYKLWWSLPIILLILFLMLFLLAAGHTGGAAFIYPLF
jgi:hypothetical protein